MHAALPLGSTNGSWVDNPRDMSMKLSAILTRHFVVARSARITALDDSTSLFGDHAGLPIHTPNNPDSLACTSTARFRNQIPQRQIVHNILNLANLVLQTITTAPKAVVFEVQELEAGMQIFNELAYEQGPRIIAQCYRISSEACLVVRQHTYETIDPRLRSSVPILQRAR